MSHRDAVSVAASTWSDNIVPHGLPQTNSQAKHPPRCHCALVPQPLSQVLLTELVRTCNASSQRTHATPTTNTHAMSNRASFQRLKIVLVGMVSSRALLVVGGVFARCLIQVLRLRHRWYGSGQDMLAAQICCRRVQVCACGLNGSPTVGRVVMMCCKSRLKVPDKWNLLPCCS